LIIDPSEIFENDPTDNEHGKAPDSDWAHDHAADMTKHVTGGNSHDHESGDGGTIDHVNLDNKGSNTHPQIDTGITNSENHIADSSDPHGVTLAQTNLVINTRICTTAGVIQDTNSHVLIESMSGGWTYIISACGKHVDYADEYFGYGSWLVYGVWNDYESEYQVRILPLFTTAYTNKILVTAVGMVVSMSYAGAGSGTNKLYYHVLRLR